MMLDIRNPKNKLIMTKLDDRIIIYENENTFGKYEHIIVLGIKSKEILAHEYYTYDDNGKLIRFRNNSFGYNYLLSKSYTMNKDDLPEDNRTYEDYIKHIKNNITLDMIFEQILEI